MRQLLILFILLFISQQADAQKFAYVDTKYILNKIPEFKQAQDKLDEFSNDWQTEINIKKNEVEEMYRTYQKEEVLLTNDMKIKRQNAIIKKEEEVIKLQQKYFSPEGELFTKREELIRPLQDKVYDAIQQLAANNKYQIVFDSSSDLIMLYKNNNLDRSDKVLDIMGY